MAYRSEMALDEMISDETGMRFQGLAVIHSQQKWPQFVACERKKDGELDAHANGASQPDGKVGLACSTRASLKKLSEDAEQAKKHDPDVQLLIFSTAEKVNEYEKELWGRTWNLRSNAHRKPPRKSPAIGSRVPKAVAACN
jgi:hypothetical protein